MTAVSLAEDDDLTADGEGVEIGALVVDCDDDDPNPAVVVNRPPETYCDEWVAYYDRRTEKEVTVADDNPHYPDDSRVVVVVFRDELLLSHPDYEADEPLRLADADCRHYAFPEGRLRRVGTFDPAEVKERDILDESMVALRDRLREAGADVAVESDAGEPVLVVRKLGAEHRVTADGEVSGGPLADRLRDVAEEYLGGGAA